MSSQNPIKTFEAEIGGELKKGSLGVFTSQTGVGKTGCLVHLATTMMLSGKNVIHVSFNENVENIGAWYREVFTEVSDKATEDKYHDMLKNRVVMNFNQDMPIAKVLESLKTMISAGAFKADAVLFDGYHMRGDFASSIVEIKEFATKANVAVWFGVSAGESESVNQFGVPKSMEKPLKNISVLIGLRYDEDKKKVALSKIDQSGKSESLHLFLDPQTMLVVK